MAKKASDNIHAKLKRNGHFEMVMMVSCMFTTVIPVMMEVGKNRGGALKYGQCKDQPLVSNNLGNCNFLDASPDNEVILRARLDVQLNINKVSQS